MRKAIFYAVAEAVAAVPGVEFVDLWNDDGSHFSGGAVYPLPAGFVGFEAVVENPGADDPCGQG